MDRPIRMMKRKIHMATLLKRQDQIVSSDYIQYSVVFKHASFYASKSLKKFKKYMIKM